MLQFEVHHRVLHLLYGSQDTLPAECIALANEYEGYVPGRVGLNFPMSIAARTALFLPYQSAVDYIIVYRKGDLATKRHELQHARYFMEEDYRRAVQQEWDSWTDAYREKVIRVLTKQMNYPADSLDRLMDEYQAYQTTERISPFGSPYKK